MSIKITSLVWEHSRHKGSALLLLLAIAEHSNNEGVCWPSIKRLARRARVSERHAKRLINELVDSGELSVDIGGGRGNTTIYKVTINKGDSGVTVSRKKVTRASQKVTRASEKGDIAMSPEPSITVKEPNTTIANGDFSFVVKTYENNIGSITKKMSDILTDAITVYSADWIVRAIHIAAENNVRKWSYVEGILKNWSTEGKARPVKNGIKTAWLEVKEQASNPGAPTFSDTRILEAVRDIWPDVKSMTKFTERETRIKFERRYNAID